MKRSLHATYFKNVSVSRAAKTIVGGNQAVVYLPFADTVKLALCVCVCVCVSM